MIIVVHAFLKQLWLLVAKCYTYTYTTAATLHTSPAVPVTVARLAAVMLRHIECAFGLPKRILQARTLQTASKIEVTSEFSSTCMAD